MISCNLPVIQVYDASKSLTEWKEMVNTLRSEYEQLLYFSIPKLLHLYQNLVGGQLNIGKIVNDVSVLFQNGHDVQRKLRQTVKVRGGVMWWVERYMHVSRKQMWCVERYMHVSRIQSG